MQGAYIMPNNTWSPKRERQYEHIKESAQHNGNSENRAKEIAARTVNKERAQHGEAKQASKSPIDDMPSSRRGGVRSHTGAADHTYAQLYNEARARGIKGRSSLNKEALEKILNEK
jgi:hypothetical protein